MTSSTITARIAFPNRNEEAIVECGEILESMEFFNIRTFSYGIIFEGEKELFEKVFGSEVTITPTGPQFATSFVLPDSLHQAEAVYFPNKPEFFS